MNWSKIDLFGPLLSFPSISPISDSRLFLVGGVDAFADTAKTWIYDLTEKKWIEGEPLTTELHYGHRMVGVKRRIGISLIAIGDGVNRNEHLSHMLFFNFDWIAGNSFSQHPITGFLALKNVAYPNHLNPLLAQTKDFRKFRYGVNATLLKTNQF